MPFQPESASRKLNLTHYPFFQYLELTVPFIILISIVNPVFEEAPERA